MLELVHVDLLEDWLKTYDPGSHVVLRGVVRRFLAFVGVPAAELIGRQKHAVGEGVYEVPRFAQGFVAQLRARRSYKRFVYSMINQFFGYHHAPFPKDPRFLRSFQMQGVQPPAVAKLTIENVKEIVMAARPRDRCMILVKWHGLMGARELEYTNLHAWPQIKEQLEEGVDIIRIDLSPRKRSDLPFYTLIGGDAITYGLKPYLDKYGDPPAKGPIWLSENGRPISARSFQYVWRGLTNRLELTPRQRNNLGTRYGYHSHETRDLASSIWTVSGANEKVCEFLMGHPKQIDSNLYKKFWKTHPQFVVDEYRKALPYLNLISGEKNTKQQQDQIRMLEEKLHASDERMAKMESILTALSGEIRQKADRI